MDSASHSTPPPDQIPSKILKQCSILTSKKKPKYQDIRTNLVTLFPLLKVPPYHFKYSTDRNKIKEALLKCWAFLLSQADVAMYADRPLFFFSISYIMQRPEFSLRALASEMDAIENKIQKSPDTNLEVTYLTRLYSTQLYVMNKLSQAAIYASLLRFCCDVTAFNYFHLGKVMSCLIDRVWAELEKDKINEKHPDVKAEIDEIISKVATTTVDSVSVERFCGLKRIIRALPKSKNLADSEEHFDKVIGSMDWLRRFFPFGDGYFLLVDKILQCALILVPASQIEWNVVPGYYHLIHAALVAVKQSSPYLSRSLAGLIKTMLSNPHILQYLVHRTLLNTNVYDAGATAATLHNICDWFEICHPRKCTHFDWQILISSLDKLLESEHIITITSTLRFLYTSLRLFPTEHKQSIIKDLILEKHFSKFFLHWSPAVRYFFHMFLLFKAINLNPSDITDADREAKATITTSIANIQKQLDGTTPKGKHYADQLEVYARASVSSYGTLLEQFKIWHKELKFDGSPLPFPVLADPAADFAQAAAAQESTTESQSGIAKAPPLKPGGTPFSPPLERVKTSSHS